MPSRAQPATRQPVLTTSADVLAAVLHPGRPAFAQRVALDEERAPGRRELTYAQLDLASAAVAGGLRAAGVTPGDRVALLGPPGVDWVVGFLGALRRGAVVVPLDDRATPGELAALVHQADPSAVLAAPHLTERARTVLEGTGGTAAVLTTGGPAGGDDGADPVGRSHSPAGPAADAVRALYDPAAVVFTAGTTGAPRGVVLSFANVAYVVSEGVRAHRPAGDDVWVSVLPLHHMLEMSCGLLPALATGGRVCFAATLMPHELVDVLRRRRATRMVVVPSLLQLLERHLRAQVAKAAGPGGTWCRLGLRLGGAVPWPGVRRLLAAPVHRRLGGRLAAFYCGGAPLGRGTAGFFDTVGIPVYQGYGLTETAPVVSANTPAGNRPGSVGRPLPGTDVRIVPAQPGADEGEILVRSPGVMLGYWRDGAVHPHAGVDGGWFATGDIGHLDADGFLHVTGRAKDLIVLDSGQKVQPEEVESALAPSPLFEEVCVVGVRVGAAGNGGGERVCAVVVPTQAVAAARPDAAALRAVLAAEVRRLAAGLSGHKRPTVVVPRSDLPRTAKRSVRRAELARLVEQEALV